MWNQRVLNSQVHNILSDQCECRSFFQSGILKNKQNISTLNFDYISLLSKLKTWYYQFTLIYHQIFSFYFIFLFFPFSLFKKTQKNQQNPRPPQQPIYSCLHPFSLPFHWSTTNTTVRGSQPPKPNHEWHLSVGKLLEKLPKIV